MANSRDNSTNTSNLNPPDDEIISHTNQDDDTALTRYLSKLEGPLNAHVIQAAYNGFGLASRLSLSGSKVPHELMKEIFRLVPSSDLDKFICQPNALGSTIFKNAIVTVSSKSAEKAKNDILEKMSPEALDKSIQEQDRSGFTPFDFLVLNKDEKSILTILEKTSPDAIAQSAKSQDVHMGGNLLHHLIAFEASEKTVEAVGKKKNLLTHPLN